MLTKSIVEKRIDPIDGKSRSDDREKRYIKNSASEKLFLKNKIEIQNGNRPEHRMEFPCGDKIESKCRKERSCHSATGTGYSKKKSEDTSYSREIEERGGEKINGSDDGPVFQIAYHIIIKGCRKDECSRPEA